MAYVSDESKRDGIYIQPFPATSNKRWQLTTRGGSWPRWSRDGREISYRSANGQVMVVPVQAGATVTWGQPVSLFTVRGLVWTGAKTSDDRLFAMIKRAPRARDPLILVKNWTAHVAETVANQSPK